MMLGREIRDHKLKILVMLSFYDEYDIDEILDKYFLSLPFEDEDYLNEYTGDLSNKYYDVYKKNGVIKYISLLSDNKKSKEKSLYEMKEKLKIFLNNFYDKEYLILEILSKYVKGWRIKQIPKCEKYILMLAIYEMYYDDSIKDISIAINEAVLLAKVYGMDDKADKFINGILGTVYRNDENINSFRIK